MDVCNGYMKHSTTDTYSSVYNVHCKYKLKVDTNDWSGSHQAAADFRVFWQMKSKPRGDSTMRGMKEPPEDSKMAWCLESFETSPTAAIPLALKATLVMLPGCMALQTEMSKNAGLPLSESGWNTSPGQVFRSTLTPLIRRFAKGALILGRGKACDNTLGRAVLGHVPLVL